MIIMIIGMFSIPKIFLILNVIHKIFVITKFNLLFFISFENFFEKLNFIFAKVKGLERLVFSLRIRKQHVQKNLQILVRHLKVYLHQHMFNPKVGCFLG
jgi:hypothetical protein